MTTNKNKATYRVTNDPRFQQRNRLWILLFGMFPTKTVSQMQDIMNETYAAREIRKGVH